MNTIKDNSDEEIDIKAILLTIWRFKYFIASFVILINVITVVVVLHLDNIYESKALLKPNQNVSSQMNKTLNSISGLASMAGVNINASGDVSPFDTMNSIIKDQSFLPDFVIKNHFQKKIFDDYNKTLNDKRYKDNERFMISQGLSDKLVFDQDSKTGIITLSIKNKDRFFTKVFIDKLLSELSQRYRVLEISNIQQQIDNYKREIDNASDITLKNKLSEVVAGLIQNKVLSEAQQYYGFDIIVKPSVPDAMDKVGPHRAVICAMSLFSSILAAILISWLLGMVFDKKKASALKND